MPLAGFCGACVAVIALRWRWGAELLGRFGGLCREACLQLGQTLVGWLADDDCEG